MAQAARLAGRAPAIREPAGSGAQNGDKSGDAIEAGRLLVGPGSAGGRKHTGRHHHSGSAKRSAHNAQNN
jgi:hypothetical protein